MAGKSPTALGGTVVTSFFVHGEPAPGGSKTFVPSRRKDGRLVITRTATGKEMPVGVMVDAGKNNKKWKRIVAACARKAYTGPPVDCALELSVIFYRQRPKSHYGTGRNTGILKASAPAYPTAQPDTTKLLRSTEDALSGIVWTNDAIIVDQHAKKRYGATTAGARIVVHRMAVTLADLDDGKGE